MICLDTNVVIGLLNKRQPRLRLRLELEERPIALSAIAFFELWYGIAKSDRRASSARQLELLIKTPVRILDFEPDDARVAADIRAALARAGTPIGPYDVLIAAQARRRDATLVTANTREFSRVPGLRLEDWTRA